MASYTPPQTVADNARRALEVRASKPPSQRGMTPVGLARARQLANQQPLSLDTIQRMVSYFERHEVDKQGSTWDEQGKGWQAWMGWGGDEGWAWAIEILAQEETNAMEDKESYKASRRHSESDMKLIRGARKLANSIKQYMVDLGDDGMDDEEQDDATMTAKAMYIEGLSERQYELQIAMTAVVEEYGKFTQGISADGAQYMAESDCYDKGIHCQHCVFFNAAAMQCGIVDGMIMPEGKCRFWIIPESVLAKHALEPSHAPEEEESGTEIEIEVAALADRNTTPAQREEMPAGDFVLPETRNFPVVTPDDIPAAVSSWGRYQGPVTFEEFKRQLIALAIRKGREFYDALPQAWRDEMEDNEKSVQNAIDNSSTMEVDDDVRMFARHLLGS